VGLIEDGIAVSCKATSSLRFRRPDPGAVGRGETEKEIEQQIVKIVFRVPRRPAGLLTLASATLYARCLDWFCVAHLRKDDTALANARRFRFIDYSSAQRGTLTAVIR
jgi:hypothetical protein